MQPSTSPQLPLKHTVVIVGSLVVLGVAVMASFAWAHHDDDPKFAIHLKTPALKSAAVCAAESPNGLNIPCSNYVTSWPLNMDADLYIVIAQVRPDTFVSEPADIAGASFGITYDDVLNSGMDIIGLPTYCADGLLLGSDSPDPVFPQESGSSIRLTWDNVTSCQNTVIGDDGIHAVVMAFSVFAYSPDTFAITPNFNLLSGAELAVANCNAADTRLDTVGVVGKLTAYADFGVGAGCNPCVPGLGCTPVTPTTWGRMKMLYRKD